MGKIMKCKAKWVRSMRTWQVHCPECDIYTIYTNPDETLLPKPHDMAVYHVTRYHKE